jgi:hypothetical protein
MPRASALAPQAVSGVRSLFINRVYKVDDFFLLPQPGADGGLKRKRE